MKMKGLISFSFGFFNPILRANPQTFVELEPVIIARSVDNHFYMLSSCLTPKGKGIDPVSNRVSQAGLLLE